ncbi:hypothetical protein BDZ97DRAFT_1752752 [Flammula alnicola]|nr:hypothetical protein BDZ97DRAFT_1752752 [Flammula alnicola]
MPVRGVARPHEPYVLKQRRVRIGTFYGNTGLNQYHDVRLGQQHWQAAVQPGAASSNLPTSESDSFHPIGSFAMRRASLRKQLQNLEIAYKSSEPGNLLATGSASLRKRGFNVRIDVQQVALRIYFGFYFVAVKFVLQMTRLEHEHIKGSWSLAPIYNVIDAVRLS